MKFSHIALAAVLASMLGGCTTRWAEQPLPSAPPAPASVPPPSVPMPPPPPQRPPVIADNQVELRSTVQNAMLLANQGLYSDAAAQLLSAAERHPSQAEDLRLRAASLYMDNGDSNAAADALARLGNISAASSARYQLESARILNARGQFQEALGTLPSERSFSDPALISRALVTRASAQEGTGDASGALNSRLTLDGFSNLSGELQYSNHMAIWRLISSMPPAMRMDLPNQVQHADLGGWLALADILARTPAGGRSDAIYRWQQQYSFHPAAQSGVLGEIAQSQVASDNSGFSTTGGFNSSQEQYQAYQDLLNQAPGSLSGAPLGARAVALLLPEGGRMKPFADAIATGVQGVAKRSDDGGPVDVRRFDSRSLAQALSQAQQSGAEIMIGPLRKDAVEQVINDSSRTLPVLALNDVGSNSAGLGALQFGLRPEDEGADAARFALSQGWRRAFVLTPTDNTGERISDAFRQTYRSGGGRIIETASFSPEAVDFRQPVERILRNGADAADMIFSPAPRQAARLLAAQLKTSDAGQLPLVATSRINTGSGNSRLDSDLDGLYFNDMPAVIAQGRINSNLVNASGIRSSDSPDVIRLKAFGADALSLARQAGQLTPGGGQQIAGLTGQLSINASGQVVRQLDWARLNSGQVRLFRRASELGNLASRY